MEQSGVEPSMRGPMGRASRPNGPKLQSQQVREAKGDRPRQHGRAHVYSKGAEVEQAQPDGQRRQAQRAKGLESIHAHALGFPNPRLAGKEASMSA